MRRKMVVIPLFLASLFGCGLCANAATATVNINYLLQNDSEFHTAATEVGLEAEKLQKKYNNEAKGKSQEEAQKLAETYQKQLNEKNSQLIAPIQKKIYAAISAVAQRKNIDTVVVVGSIVYGESQQDITQEVEEKLK